VRSVKGEPVLWRKRGTCAGGGVKGRVKNCSADGHVVKKTRRGKTVTMQCGPGRGGRGIMLFLWKIYASGRTGGASTK